MNQDQDKMHPDDLRNLLVFIVLAVVIWVSYDHFLLQPKLDAMQKAQQEKERQLSEKAQMPGVTNLIADLKPRDQLIRGGRIALENDMIDGSFNLKGARFDDINLKSYFKTAERSEEVHLFSPVGSYHPRYTGFGWVASDKAMRVPTKDDTWQIAPDSASRTLAPNQTVTIFWDNGQGLRFERDLSIDDQYLFTVKQRVINNSGREVTLFPFGLIAQHGLPEDLYGRWIVHEGPIGYIDGELTELSYKKIQDKPQKEVTAAEGWIAMTEHYWLTSLFPEVKDGNQFRFLFKEPEAEGQLPTFQVDVMGAAQTIAAGESAENTTHFFAGPKKLSLLEGYEKDLDLKHIDLSVDFGMYYFMTKPLYYLLHWLRDIVGNFGIAIILLTVLVRLMVFPLANKSFKSFAGLRKIAPKMTEMREKYGDDREKLQQELVKLYEKEGVNPMAGCMPILIQIPIFFALFKVFQISIEMRHEPFFGWINDLSAPDPTSIFNLFGLIPWDPPQQLMIGAWPCLMLIFLILQKKMNPPPQDKMQKIMMDVMPFFITYLLSGFAAGLVIYWTFSNALSVVQQYIIMTNMGVKPELFKSKAQKEEERKMREANVHPGMEMLKDDLKEAEEKFEEALFGDEEEQKAALPPKEISKPKPKKSKKKK